jgi:hypothetical protein
MSTSLLDSARQYVTPEVLDRLTAFAGESPAATTKAISGAAPAVLAGMLHSAQDANGLTQLVNLFQQGKFDGSMLDNVAGAYSGSSMDGLMKMGGPLLGSIFGARSNGLVELLAGYAGIRKSSAMSLLSAVAPLVMSIMGRQLMAKGGINAGSLKELLVSQRGVIAASAPPGLGQLLGIGDLSGLGANMGQQARSMTPVPVPAPRGGLRKLLPIVLAVVVLLLLFVILRSCGGSPETVTPPRDTLNTMAPDTGAPAATSVRPAPRIRGAGIDTAAIQRASGTMPSTDTPTAAPSATPPTGGAMGGQGTSGQAP